MLALEVHNLNKSYHGVAVLRGVNFSCGAGRGVWALRA